MHNYQVGQGLSLYIHHYIVYANKKALGRLHLCRLSWPSLLPDTITKLSQSGAYKNEPRHGISNNVVCATSKASDQPALMHSLIRDFASLLNIL